MAAATEVYALRRPGSNAGFGTGSRYRQNTRKVLIRKKLGPYRPLDLRQGLQDQT